MSSRAIRPGRVIRASASLWLSNWADWVTFCILWVLCQFSIVLGPPATFALAQAAREAVLESRCQLPDLVAAARRYFGLAWAWMLPNLALGGLLAWAYAGSAALEGLGQGLVRAALLLVALAGFGLQFYSLPGLMLEDKPDLIRTWRATARLMGAVPWLSLSIGAFAVLVLLTATICVTPLALGIPGFLLILASEAVFELRALE